MFFLILTYKRSSYESSVGHQRFASLLINRKALITCRLLLCFAIPKIAAYTAFPATDAEVFPGHVVNLGITYGTVVALSSMKILNWHLYSKQFINKNISQICSTLSRNELFCEEKVRE